jgi:predicted nucleic acid-binding protein
MTLVVDASVAISWCFSDDQTGLAERTMDRVGAEAAVVPSLWRFEVANVVMLALRKGRIDESRVVRFLGWLDRLPISIAVPEPRLVELVDLGQRHRLTAYDAAYLWLTLSKGLPLATLDITLADAARAAGVAVVA